MNAVTLSTVSIAAVTASVAVDKAVAKAGDAKQVWAVYAAAAVVDNRATMDDIAAAIVVAVQGRMTKAKAAHCNTIADCSKAGFSTITGWFYDLRRVEKAGRLVELTGKDAPSLTTLRRGTDSTTANKGKAPAKAPAKVADSKGSDTAIVAPLVQPALPVLTQTLADMATHLEGEAKRLSFKALRNMQPEISRALHALQVMTNKIDAGIKAEIKAKADKAAAAAARKAGRSSRRKAA